MTDTNNQTEAEPNEAGGGEIDAAARIAELEAEVLALKDQHLRALAEVENVRRRTAKEREDAVRYAAASVARDLLSVADNLRRAQESVPDAESQGDVVKTLIEGVAATERELMASFERNGIKQVSPLDQKFDHNLHQAIFEVENTGKPAGTVVQVLQAGYVLHDRLLRPAMVGVAKGGAEGEGGDRLHQPVDTSA
jgi:molecular chaperone GrpE